MPAAKVTKKLTAEAEWAVGKIEAEGKGMWKCPYDDWTPVVNDPAEARQAIGEHLMRDHADQIEFAMAYPELGWDARANLLEKKKLEEDELFDPAMAGLTVGEDNENFDMLYVPNGVKQTLKKRGSKRRWVTSDNAQRYKDRGYRFVERSDDLEMPQQFDHSDTKVRSRELMLMEIPEPIVKAGDARKARAIEESGNPDARIENRMRQLGDVEEKAYDHYRGQGVPHENAMKLARTVGARVSQGDFGQPHVSHEPGANVQIHRR